MRTLDIFKEREIDLTNALRMSVLYTESVPELASKFVDVRTEVCKAILKDPVGYGLESIMPNPLEGNKIKKCFNRFNKEWMGERKVVDLTKMGESSEEETNAVRLIKRYTDKFDFASSDEVETIIRYYGIASDNLEVFLELPRGNRLTQAGSSCKTVRVQNAFNAYGTEGFTIAYNNIDYGISISFSTASILGLKGKGTVNVYLRTQDSIYVDDASKYLDIRSVLQLFRG